MPTSENGGLPTTDESSYINSVNGIIVEPAYQHPVADRNALFGRSRLALLLFRKSEFGSVRTALMQNATVSFKSSKSFAKYLLVAGTAEVFHS